MKVKSYALLISGLLLCAQSYAQVEKRVEVVKDYTPSLPDAKKLAVAPNMSDTTAITPEIDYAVVPRSMDVSVEPDEFKPAKVTYWEYNKPKPFYLKLGTGYPLNTLADFYYTLDRTDRGYVSAGLNHYGEYYEFEHEYIDCYHETPLSQDNRAFVNGGVYFGDKTLSLGLDYKNLLDYREEVAPSDVLYPHKRVNFGEGVLSVGFGDDFSDLSRVNYNVACRGVVMHDNSQSPMMRLTSDFIGMGYRQYDFGAKAKVGYAIQKYHSLTAALGFDGQWSNHKFGYRDLIVSASLLYNYDGGWYNIGVGLDYYNDRNDYASRDRNYLLPNVKLSFYMLDGKCSPFFESTGSVESCGFGQLLSINRYAVFSKESMASSKVDYNTLLGVEGKLLKGTMSYKAWAQYTHSRNYLYWFMNLNTGSFIAHRAPQNAWSFHGELSYRPIAGLDLGAGVHGYIYTNQVGYWSGMPVFTANVDAAYTYKQVAFGLNAEVVTSRGWRSENIEALSSGAYVTVEEVTAPAYLNLCLSFNWNINSTISLFVDGKNLCNAELYDWARYAAYGAHFTAGVKLQF